MQYVAQGQRLFEQRMSCMSSHLSPCTLQACSATAIMLHLAMHTRPTHTTEPPWAAAATAAPPPPKGCNRSAVSQHKELPYMSPAAPNLLRTQHPH